MSEDLKNDGISVTRHEDSSDFHFFRLRTYKNLVHRVRKISTINIKISTSRGHFLGDL